MMQICLLHECCVHEQITVTNVKISMFLPCAVLRRFCLYNWEWKIIEGNDQQRLVKSVRSKRSAIVVFGAVIILLFKVKLASSLLSNDIEWFRSGVSDVFKSALHFIGVR